MFSVTILTFSRIVFRESNVFVHFVLFQLFIQVIAKSKNGKALHDDQHLTT